MKFVQTYCQSFTVRSSCICHHILHRVHLPASQWLPSQNLSCFLDHFQSPVQSWQSLPLRLKFILLLVVHYSHWFALMPLVLRCRPPASVISHLSVWHFKQAALRKELFKEFWRLVVDSTSPEATQISSRTVKIICFNNPLCV